MSKTRIFQKTNLEVGQTIELDDKNFGHAIRVLRLKEGDPLTIFNGEGGEFLAKISQITKKTAFAQLTELLKINIESPLNIWLDQGISRGDKMDLTIQKATELGVKKIIPMFTERCGVKLTGERLDKKLSHWQSVAISAAEQSGRTKIPEVVTAIDFRNFIENEKTLQKYILNPKSSTTTKSLKIDQKDPIVLAIGPEGGFSNQEIQIAEMHNFFSLSLGPRVLRTETAGIAAILALQTIFGDIG